MKSALRTQEHLKNTREMKEKEKGKGNTKFVEENPLSGVNNAEFGLKSHANVSRLTFHLGRPKIANPLGGI